VILTVLPPHHLPRALAAFAAALDDPQTGRVFRCIAVPA
jgi:hypothetical protein